MHPAHITFNSQNFNDHSQVMIRTDKGEWGIRRSRKNSSATRINYYIKKKKGTNYTGNPYVLPNAKWGPGGN